MRVARPSSRQDSNIKVRSREEPCGYGTEYWQEMEVYRCQRDSEFRRKQNEGLRIKKRKNLSEMARKKSIDDPDKRDRKGILLKKRCCFYQDVKPTFSCPRLDMDMDGPIWPRSPEHGRPRAL